MLFCYFAILFPYTNFMKPKKKFLYTHNSEKFSRKQFVLYKKRLKSVNLTWCNQVLDFITAKNIKSMKDIGCNYFQFYKELKLRKLKLKYFGSAIEIEEFNPEEDRIMICGSEEMTFEIKGIFEKLGSLEGSTKVQGGFVIEKAFAEK